MKKKGTYYYPYIPNTTSYFPVEVIKLRSTFNYYLRTRVNKLS